MNSSKNISWSENSNLKVNFQPKVPIILKLYSGCKTFIIYFVKQCYYFKVLVYMSLLNTGLQFTKWLKQKRNTKFIHLSWVRVLVCHDYNFCARSCSLMLQTHY